MATELGEQRRAHIRGVTVTAIASLSGVGAALLSSAIASGAEDATAVLLFGAFVLAQFPLLRLVGIEVEEFSAKDYLYIAFMTFALWFITWGILLTSNTTVSL